MHHSKFIVLALAASNNLAAARPVVNIDSNIDARDLGALYAELSERDPGILSSIKAHWDGPVAKATAATCYAGAVATLAGCVAGALPPGGTSHHLSVASGMIGTAAMGYDAATQWAKIYKDGKKKPDDVEMQRTNGEQAEHLLTNPHPVTQEATSPTHAPESPSQAHNEPNTAEAHVAPTHAAVAPEHATVTPEHAVTAEHPTPAHNEPNEAEAHVAPTHAAVAPAPVAPVKNEKVAEENHETSNGGQAHVASGSTAPAKSEKEPAEDKSTKGSSHTPVGSPSTTRPGTPHSA